MVEWGAPNTPRIAMELYAPAPAMGRRVPPLFHLEPLPWEFQVEFRHGDSIHVRCRFLQASVGWRH